MSNKVWLSQYRNYSVLNIHSIDASIPNVKDAVTIYNFKQKQRNQTMTDKEHEEYHQMLTKSQQYYLKWEAGELLNEMPTKLYLKPDSQIPTSNEHFFRIRGGYLVMDQTSYDIFSTSRLGNTHFSQVYLFDIQTEERLSDTPYYFINIAETRQFLLAEQSEGIVQHKNAAFYMIQEPKDKDVVLGTSHMDVDIWRDPMLLDSLFLSDTLVQALADAGIKKEALGLVSCQIK